MRRRATADAVLLALALAGEEEVGRERDRSLHRACFVTTTHLPRY
jgi:hypothetical protein